MFSIPQIEKGPVVKRTWTLSLGMFNISAPTENWLDDCEMQWFQNISLSPTKPPSFLPSYLLQFYIYLWKKKKNVVSSFQKDIYLVVKVMHLVAIPVWVVTSEREAFQRQKPKQSGALLLKDRVGLLGRKCFPQSVLLHSGCRKPLNSFEISDYWESWAAPQKHWKKQPGRECSWHQDWKGALWLQNLTEEYTLALLWACFAISRNLS